jgi:hypothetical protein
MPDGVLMQPVWSINAPPVRTRAAPENTDSIAMRALSCRARSVCRLFEECVFKKI